MTPAHAQRRSITEKEPIMKRFVVLGVLAVVAAAAFAAAVKSEQPPTLREFMRAKLSHSQKVLEGLTTADFDLIARNSQAMSLLSQESTWNVLQTTEYLDAAATFTARATA